jgi:hypothetical protein
MILADVVVLPKIQKLGFEDCLILAAVTTDDHCL